MFFSPPYVLLLASQPIEALHGLESLLQQLPYTVEIVDSIDQAVAKVAQEPPCLVILQEQPWTRSLIRQLRTLQHADRITLVMLTEPHSPSWLHQDQNPGVDGFLVKPLSSDVLSSLIQSASARLHCLQPQ